MGKNNNKLELFQNGETNTVSEKESTGLKSFLENLKSNLPANVAEKFAKAIENEIAEPPKIAIIGKSGTGKTTTINSLFNVEWHVSETVTGTTEIQKETFKLTGEGKLTVIDMPGLGDSIANDLKFIEIYKEILPEVDVILYVIQADDRALGEDERIIRDIILQCGKDLHKKLVIAINKVDLLGENEGLEWNDSINLPNEAQEQLIKRKCADISKRLSQNLGIKEDGIEYYSAIKYYRLYDLLKAIVLHSGCKGWKIAINPKDFTDLVDEKYRKVLRGMK